MSKRGENIYKRKDGRWEGRYVKCRGCSARPTKTPVEMLHVAESKNEPLSRKNSGKAAQNRVRKGSSPKLSTKKEKLK